MAFCMYCGHPVDEGSRFCPNCGKQILRTASQPSKESIDPNRKGGAEKKVSAEPSGNAVKTAGAAAGRIAGHTGGLASRIAAGILSLILAVGGVATAAVEAGAVTVMDKLHEIEETIEKEMPEPVSEEERAYREYLSLLAIEREELETYTWQKGFHGNSYLSDEMTTRNAVIADICGDELPELVTVRGYTDEYGTLCTNLEIYGCIDGYAEMLYSERFDVMAGGGFHYDLFQIADEKNLYVYEAYGEEYWTIDFSRMDEQEDGSLGKTSVLRRDAAPGGGYNLQNYDITYTQKEEEITEEEYGEAKQEIYQTVKAVLMYSLNADAELGVFAEENGCPAMTAREAITWLRGEIGRIHPPEERSAVDVLTLPVSLNEFLTCFSAWYQGHYGDYSGLEYDAKHASDGSSNILASIVHNGSCVNFSRYPVAKPIDHWDVKDPMGWENLGYGEFDAEAVRWIARNIFNITDEDIAALETQAEDNRQFHLDRNEDGAEVYLVPIGGVGDPFTAAVLTDAVFDGSRYYLVYDLYFYAEKYYGQDGYDPTDGDYLGSYYAIMEYKTIGEHQYWSMYTHSEDLWNADMSCPESGLFGKIPPTYTARIEDSDYLVRIDIDEGGFFTGKTVSKDAFSANASEAGRSGQPFWGVFKKPERKNGYMVSMEVGSVYYLEEGEENRPLRQGDKITVYLTGTPLENLPEKFLSSVKMGREALFEETDRMPLVGLYDEKTGASFLAEGLYRNWSEAYKAFVMHGDFLSDGNTDLGYADYAAGSNSAVDFALFDIEQDGIPELIICNGFNGRDLRHSYVFTFADGAVRYLGDLPSGAYTVTGYPGLFSQYYASGYYLDDKYKDKYSYVISTRYTTVTDGELDTTRVAEIGCRPDGSEDYIFICDDYELYTVSTSMAYPYATRHLYEIKRYGWQDFVSLANQVMYSNGNRVRTLNIKFEGNTTVDLQWGFDLFSKSATEYDHSIAMAGNILSQAAESGEGECRARLKALGFSNILSYDYGENFDQDKPAFSFGSQLIYMNDKPTVMAVIVVRGTVDNGDWLTDIGSVFNGFLPSARRIRKSFMSYYQGLSQYYGIEVNPDNTILFITGHSMGGAVSGLLAQTLEGNTARKDSLFCYTYASALYETFKYDTSKFGNVQNIINLADIVPRVPPNGHHYGHEWYYDNDKGRIVPNHILSTYLESMVSGLPSNMGGGVRNPYSRSSIHCPVDIRVLDKNGELEAWTVGEQVFHTASSEVLVLTEGDAKYVYAPEDTEYQIVIRGTDDGEMTYLRETIDAVTGEVLEETAFEHVPLREGIAYTSTVTKEKETELFELNEAGRVKSRISEDGKASAVWFRTPLWGYIGMGAAVLGLVMLAVSILSLLRYRKRKNQA